MNLLQEAGALPLAEYRRYLHSHAELGFDLKNTISYVKKQLKSMGLQPKVYGKAGLAADIIGRKPGGIFLLRADMDALPIREEADVSFANQNGQMHACGHDLHTAMLLGAAQLLINHREELYGTVRLMFQPAEEILQGAADMIGHGILDGVEGAMMLHVLTCSELPTGTVILPAAGVSAPSADFFTVAVHGSGCHGALPHTGIDPIPPACHILQALQTIQTREMPPEEGVVLTVGSFQAGAAANVIADKAILKGTMRTYSEETRRKFKNRMVRMVKNLAGTFRAEAAVFFDTGCPTLVNHQRLIEQASEILPQLLGEEKVITPQMLSQNARGSGSEDFAYVSHEVPSLMVALAAGQKSEGHIHPAHHPKTTFDEAVLPYGAAIYAQMALKKADA